MLLRQAIQIKPLAILICFFFGAALIEGCSHHRYRASPYCLSQTDLSENVERAFDSKSVIDGELLYEHWWEFFQDSQLNQMIELSLSCHPSIKIADARIRQACEQARIARSTLFPHLFLYGDVKRERVSRLGTEFIPGKPSIFTETTIGLTSAFYELDIWNKNHARYYAALDQMQATIADFEEAKLLLSTSIAGVYFELQMNQAELMVTKERLKKREELYSLLRQQFDMGIISEYRLYETDTEIELLKNFALQLEGEIEINKHALAALVGNTECGCTEMIAPPSAVFESSFPLPCSLPIDLLARRPDITAAKWRVEASCFDIHIAKANFLPRIDLLGNLGVQSIFIDKLLRGEAIFGTFNVLGTLPIFLAGKLKGELGVARGNLEIAIEDYNQLVLDAVQQVSDALTELVKADERNQTLNEGVEDAEELLDLTTQKFENGITNKIAVLNAIENVLILKDLQIQIAYDRFQAAVNLIRAIGGGYYDCGCT